MYWVYHLNKLICVALHAAFIILETAHGTDYYLLTNANTNVYQAADCAQGKNCSLIIKPVLQITCATYRKGMERIPLEPLYCTKNCSSKVYCLHVTQASKLQQIFLACL